MASTTSFLSAVAARRSAYALAKESPIPNASIVEIVHAALEHCPSPFNVRSSRAIVVFGDHHTKLWEVAYSNMGKAVDEQTMAMLGPKIKGFAAAYGTVSFVSSTSFRSLLLPIYSLSLPLPRKTKQTLAMSAEIGKQHMILTPTKGSFPRRPIRLRKPPPALQSHGCFLVRVGGTLLRHAPIHRLDGALGRGSRLQPPALPSRHRTARP